MKFKFGIAFAAVAIGVIAFGALSPNSSAVAQEPQDAPGYEVDTPDPFGGVRLRESIIACAAKTIGIREHEVRAGLRAGASLKEIAARHGVRPNELKRGILDCEADLLRRLVDAGLVTRLQAARIMNYLTDHIDRIISFHYQP